MVKLKQNDWKTLFPTEVFVIGDTKLEIVPLTLEKLPRVIRDLKTIATKLQEKEITFGEFGNNLEEVLMVVIAEAPGLISELAGLDKEDVARLPIGIAIDLLTKCLEVNLTDQSSFLKNLTTLIEKMTQMIATGQGILES